MADILSVSLVCVVVSLVAAEAVPIQDLGDGASPRVLWSGSHLVGSSLFLAMIVMMPVITLSLFCCSGMRRRQKQVREKESSEFENSLGGFKNPRKLTKETLMIHNEDFIVENKMTGTLSYSESVSFDDKLGCSTDGGGSQESSKQASCHASFKLPMFPTEDQMRSSLGLRAIPPPRLVSESKSPELTIIEYNSPLQIPVQLSPVEHKHFSKFKKKAVSVDEATLWSDLEDRPLIRTNSLEHLLTSREPIVMELTQDKKSKYSRVTIMASTSALDHKDKSLNEQEGAAEKEIGFPVESHLKEVDEVSAPDSCSIASFTLTADMLSLSSSSSTSCSPEHEPNLRAGDQSIEEREESPSEVVIELITVSPIPQLTSSCNNDNTLSSSNEARHTNEGESDTMPDKGQQSTPVKRAKKKNRKASKDDGPPIMSPPHTPPPLPPELIKEREVATAETAPPATKDDTIDRLSAGREESEDLGETCLRCGLPLPPVDTDESTGSPSTTTLSGEEPIYHVLERPLLCEDCLRNDRRISQRQLPSPPVPSPPLPPFSPIPPPPPREAAPLYERVGSFRKSDSAERRAPPLSLTIKAQSSSDYESIPSFDPNRLESPLSKGATLEAKRTSVLNSIKGKEGNTSSDYESIKSLDWDADRYHEASEVSNGMPLRIMEEEDMRGACADGSHDYETIDCFSMTQGIDIDSPVSLPFTGSERAMRSKLLKVDSQGYASVLYPHDEDESESWEFDCLNQERYRNKSVGSGSSVTVKSSEEAWKHQLEKGYAPLTLQREPPPVFSRTRSAPTVTPAPIAQQPEPQDYEVPLDLLTQPLPPPSVPPPRHIIALKRSSLTRQPAQDLSTPPSGEAARALTDVLEEENQTVSTRKEGDDQAEMRCRLMTAPSTTSFDKD